MNYVNKMLVAYKKAVLENYANFTGRARVGDYWWFFLANFIISFVLSIIDNVMANLLGFAIFGTIYSLAVLVPGIAAGVRRLRGWCAAVPRGSAWR